jgi:hypothetical protein
MPRLCVMGIGLVVARKRVLVHEIHHRGVRAVERGGVRSASQLIDRFAQADVRGTKQVLNRGAQALAREAQRCTSQVLGRCARPLPAAPLGVRLR